jgi:WD40 repeat protein
MARTITAPCKVLPLVAALALLAAMLPVRAQQQPSSEPMLRVETGMHTAEIKRAAADAVGHILATASDDKTVRLWSLTNGEPLRVLRPLIGDGDEGKLYAVAVSPDGKLVAAGGVTAATGKAVNIYLFDAASGRLVRGIAGLPEVVNQLAWSPDGQFIAAALGGNNGIRVFRSADGREAARDTDYGDDSYGLAFDRSGRLAAVSYDRFARLYDPQFRRVAKAKTPGGKRPYSVSFSPEGTRLAIGYENTTAVDVLSADGLKRLFSADTGGVKNGDLGAVAWTSDGALLAGGGYHDRHGRPVLRWPQGGKGAREALPAADGTISSIVPLADGGFVYATADYPAFGNYDAQQRRVFERRADIPDYRDQEDKLRLSADANAIGFGLQAFGRQPMHFSVDDRRLTAGAAPGDLVAADAQGLPVTHWEYTGAPKLAGKSLQLEQDEYSQSVAVAPDHKSLLLGTDWYLRRFDASGTETWSQPAPSHAWAVNVSRDGRLAVAAFGDATIRWYRYADGKELLALFVHRDGKRWVLWTPQGYYDAAPGAEDLIGWHINRGPDHEADFFPASRFRDRFYKPEVVSAVLKTLDTDKALAAAKVRPSVPLAAEALPPVIKILAPTEGAEVTASPIQVRYAVRSPSGERVTAIEVKLEGRPLPGGQGVVKLENGPASPQAEQEGTIAVAIDHDAAITLVARAGERQSEAANLHLAWKPPAPTPAPAQAEVPKPKLYVLAVGVGHYQEADLQLHYAGKDAADVAAAWAKQQGGLYREVDTRLLQDAQATRDAILDGLDWIERETTARDVALVLMSGHGDNDADGAYYFLPYDVDPDRLRRSAVPDVEIRRSLSHISGKALFFFDTCHSGSVMPGRKAAPTDINGFVSDLASAENGLVVFAASTGREFAQERDEWKNGAFSKALIEGLSGKADISGKGVITISALEFWLAERVKELTLGQQHPTTAKPSTIRDFPIAIDRPAR